jgi:hypothetical protein
MAKIIRFPMGNANTSALTATGAQALTISDTLTIIDGVTVEATGNRTLNLTLADDLVIGSKIVVQSKTNGTETTIFGTLMTGITITGVAGKTICNEFVFDGTTFLQSGAQVQVD